MKATLFAMMLTVSLFVPVLRQSEQLAGRGSREP
jgi:hypothetical protein